jgi:hypothetical protein
MKTTAGINVYDAGDLKQNPPDFRHMVIGVEEGKMKALTVQITFL